MVGDLLRTYRERAALPQDVCARQLGITPSLLCHIEAGRRTPSRPLLERAAKVLALGPADWAALLFAAGYAAPLVCAQAGCTALAATIWNGQALCATCLAQARASA
jgi:transcriptional regulator with XRE-family HTH domain